MSDEIRPVPSRSRQSRTGLMLWYRYIPLFLLVVGVIAMSIIGSMVKNQAVADTANATPTVAASALPEACSPDLDQGLAGEPWSDPARLPSSEAQFQAAAENADPLYVVGKDGWRFWNDGQINDLSQSIGRVSLDDAQASAWAAYFSSLQQIAAEHGSSFYVVVAPAKWDVYPGQMGDWAQNLRGTVSFDKLLAAHPELPLIDTRSALREASGTTNTYTPLNSHWNDYGGYVGWDVITQCIGQAEPSLAAIRVPDISGVSASPDHAEFTDVLPLSDTNTDWKSPELLEPHPPTTVTSVTSGLTLSEDPAFQVEIDRLPAETRTVGAQSDKSLLVLRDSTSNSLSTLMTQSFAHTVMYEHNVGVPSRQVDFSQILDEHPSDVTLFVMTERYLGFAPPTLD